VACEAIQRHNGLLAAPQIEVLVFQKDVRRQILEWYGLEKQQARELGARYPLDYLEEKLGLLEFLKQHSQQMIENDSGFAHLSQWLAGLNQPPPFDHQAAWLVWALQSNCPRPPDESFEPYLFKSWVESGQINLRSGRVQAHRRLQRLYHHQVVNRHKQTLDPGKGRLPLIYSLDEKGISLVAGSDGPQKEIRKPKYARRLGSLFRNHTIAVNDFMVCIEWLAKVGLFDLMEYRSEFKLRSDQKKAWDQKKAAEKKVEAGEEVPIPEVHRVPFSQVGERVVHSFPDGFFVLQVAEGPVACFLEVDRATMPLRRWKRKIKSYLSYRNSGIAEKVYGYSNYRILTVTSSPERLKNLRKATEQAGGDDFFWFLTQDQVDIWRPDKILHPHWKVCGDERPRYII
jgi:hypothetical protein